LQSVPPECGVIGHRQHCWGSSAFVSILCVAADGDLLLAVSLAGFRFTVIGWVATCFFHWTAKFVFVGLKVQQWVREGRGADLQIIFVQFLLSSSFIYRVLYVFEGMHDDLWECHVNVNKLIFVFV
jgi:hypothetical protein